jgi:hypothetical protein
MAEATKPHIGSPRKSAWLKDEEERTSNLSLTRNHPSKSFELDIRTGWSANDKAQHVRVRLSDSEVASLIRFALDRGITPHDFASGSDRYVEL